MTDSILITQGLSKRFGDLQAVSALSFEIKRGEIFSLLGPNGAGKTTTISMLSCLLPPSAGDAHINGHSVSNQSDEVKRLIGVIPQELALYDTLSAAQNLQFWGTMYGLGRREIKVRSAELLEQVGLSDRAKDRVDTFSGGMKRRLNIAIGLMHRPQLVFMDEPTVGIDPQSRRRILDMVLELRDQGMTVLYTTHYMEEAEELSDRVGIIDHGRMIACGTQKELTQLIGQQETLRLHLAEDVELSPEGQVALTALFESSPLVQQAIAHDHQVAVSVADAAVALPTLMRTAAAEEIRLRSIDIEEPNLEAVFLHLTGRALRDD